MSMTNAQAALIAAASTDTTGDIENVRYMADWFIKWLDKQDAASRPAQPPQLHTSRCTRKSPSGESFCDLPDGHGGKCENSHEGIAWGGTGL